MSNGQLQKLVIKAYTDPEFRNEASDGALYTTAVNPETYSMTLKTEYNEQSGQGNSSATPKFVRTIPEELELDFLFDRTGVFQNNDSAGSDNGNGIEEDIENFKKTVFRYNGEIHKPNYLKVSWGTLLFQCVLLELNIEYKLFRPDGKPLRAVGKAKFKSLIDEEKRAAEENNSSPDLTHIRTVYDGDTLPLMTHKIYGDSKYYLEVAKVNNLTNFRKLKVGDRLYFPPIDKLAQ